MEIILGIFFIVHGLIHLSFISPTPPSTPNAPVWPFYLDHSWLGLPTNVLSIMGTILTIVAAVGFLLVGFGTLGWLVPLVWIKPIAIVAASASILLMTFFWNNWYVVGALLSTTILVYFLT